VKETVIYKRRSNTQKNTKLQNAQNRGEKIQNKETNIKRILKKISRVIRKEQKEADNNEITYCTEPTYNYISMNQIKSKIVHTFHHRFSRHFISHRFPK
jgi:hypothetical protein